MPVCRVWKIWILEKTNEFLIHYKTHNIKVDVYWPQKGGKKQAPASNVPKWSNPDYVNELDPKIVDMLVEFHKSQGTLERKQKSSKNVKKSSKGELSLRIKNKSFWTAWTNRVSQVLCLQIIWAIN